MILDVIKEKLNSLQDKPYREFNAKLLPTLPLSAFIGVRTPFLRKLAKEFSLHRDIDVFLKDVPHRYFEENQLHAFIISCDKDYASCMERLEFFLPYVDNWATCDQMNPKVLKQNGADFLLRIKSWIFENTNPYAVRFGIKMLMDFFLDDKFDARYLQWVSKVRSKEYYVQMMVAWYFATALAKHYKEALFYLENGLLEDSVVKKTVKKACESFRVKEAHKKYLQTLCLKNS